MAVVSQETIDRVRDAADIVAVITPYVNLKKQGQNYVGLCPFHDDSHPSMHVSQRKQIFKCFACGVGGNAITFLMEYEKISFIEALKRLARQTGIPLDLKESPEKKDVFTGLYDLHDFAADVYSTRLFSEAGAGALTGLKERGLEEAMIKEYRLGLAPDSWDYLLKKVRSGKFTDDVIRKSGLFTKTEKGEFDRFRKRIMFPIFNLSGRVVAFGGRALDDDPAKYLNSPETPIYHKSEIFYGLHATRDAIRRQDQAILVEGYMDYLQLVQAGIPNVIAVSGTALAEKHVTQLRKFTSRVIVAYDGDTAGKKAALRAGYLLLQQGLDPRILEIPGEQDPDEWVRTVGKEPFLAAVAQARPLIQFHMDFTGAKTLKGAPRAALIQDILEDVARIRDSILRAEFIREIAEELAVEERELVQRLAQFRSRRRRPPNSEKTGAAPQAFTGVEQAQADLLRILTGNDADARLWAIEHIKIDQFPDPVFREAAKYALKSPDPAALVDQFQDRESREKVAAVLIGMTEFSDPQQMVRDCLRMLNVHQLREAITTRRLQIKQLENAGKDPEALIVEVAQLQQELRYAQNP
ncbi:MAG: DNA primase [FCB group bacterium]|nr:DNA primase [FCB group bacterium]